MLLSTITIDIYRLFNTAMPYEETVDYNEIKCGMMKVKLLSIAIKNIAKADSYIKFRNIYYQLHMQVSLNTPNSTTTSIAKSGSYTQSRNFCYQLYISASNFSRIFHSFKLSYYNFLSLKNNCRWDYIKFIIVRTLDNHLRLLLLILRDILWKFTHPARLQTAF